MKEKLKEFVAAKRAVSPVIGVVLMVAVVVILAAVIGAFVLGLGGDQQAAPQATFSYEAPGAGGGVLVHQGGDTIDSGHLKISIDGKDLKDGTISGSDDEISVGETITLPTDPTESIRLIYTDGSGSGKIIWETTV